MSQQYLAIQRIVEREAGLAPLACRSKRIGRAYSGPRWVAIQLCRDFFPHSSLVQLGKAFCRDHTTILNALNRFHVRGLGRHPLYRRCKPLVERSLRAGIHTKPMSLVARAEPGGQVWVR